MNINKRQKLLVYLLLSLLAVIFVFVEVSLFNREHSLDGLFLNLATEIAGVVIIFLILRFFLRDTDEETANLLLALKKERREEILFWDSREKDKNLFPVTSLLQNAKEVYIVGYNLRTLLDDLRYRLPDLINKKNLKVKILTLKPDLEDHAFSLMVKNQENKDTLLLVAKSSERYMAQIRNQINKAKSKNFETRYLTWIPSCAMIIIIDKQGTGKAKITFNYPCPHTPTKFVKQRLTTILDRSYHKEEFRYFKEHFELLWNPVQNQTTSTDESISNS